MLNKGLTSFHPAKIQQNPLFSPKEEDYQAIRTSHNHTPSQHPSTQQPQREEVVDLEDLWNAAECEQQATQIGKIRVCILNVDNHCQQEQQEPFEISEEEFQRMAQGGTEKQTEREEVVDLEDLWDQVNQEETTRPTDRTIKTQNQPKKDSKPQENKAVQAVQAVEPPQASTPIPTKSQGFDVNTLLSQKGQKSFNLNLHRDFLIYDYHTFVMSCYQTNIHSYFGFSQSPFNRNLYHLYDLTTKEPFLQCSVDSCDQSLLRNNNKKAKVQYQLESCLKFRLSKNGQLVATAFHKYINNGILYNIKPYNSFQNQYEDPFALVEITDGFIGSNCYCNTNVYISQKYTNQPGQLKMVIGVKNGFLIANMGVNGVKSAPYNCRLENSQNSFVYLLGMVDKESGQFIVRVGQGMSPLIALAISIGRKRYIDSFTQ